MARVSLAASMPAGSGAPGSTSPIGQGVVLASGRFGVTATGVKNGSSRPRGSAIQPCEPKRRATTVIAFGSVIRTSCFARSTIGLLTFFRAS